MLQIRTLALVVVVAAGACASDTPESSEPQVAGAQEGWTASLDKNADQVFATDGLQAVSLDPSAPRQTHQDLLDAGLGEHVANGWQAWACRAACVGLAATSCWAIGAACVGASVISVGGFLIPCAVATAAACVGGAVAAQVCSDYCGQAFP